MGEKKKRVTIEQAIDLINRSYAMPEGYNAVSKGHLYNLISQKKLTRYGPHRIVLLDPDEVIRVCGDQSA